MRIGVGAGLGERRRWARRDCRILRPQDARSSVDSGSCLIGAAAAGLAPKSNLLTGALVATGAGWSMPGMRMAPVTGARGARRRRRRAPAARARLVHAGNTDRRGRRTSPAAAATGRAARAWRSALPAACRRPARPPSAWPARRSGRRIYRPDQTSAAVSLAALTSAHDGVVPLPGPRRDDLPTITPMRPNYESSSGADTPNTVRPLTKTCRTAPTSASRANVSFGSSALTNRNDMSSLPFAQKPWKAAASS